MAGIPDSERGKARLGIIQAAEDLAGAHGFDALTLTALCDASGMQAPQVRYHVRNTAQLLFLVLDKLWLTLLNGLETPDDMPADERLATLCRTYASTRAGDLARHLGTVPWGRMSAVQRSTLRHRQRLVLQTFHDAVAACRPGMPDAGAMVLALSLVAMLDGYAAWSREPGALDPDSYASLAMRMALAGAPDGQPQPQAVTLPARPTAEGHRDGELIRSDRKRIA